MKNCCGSRLPLQTLLPKPQLCSAMSFPGEELIPQKDWCPFGKRKRNDKKKRVSTPAASSLFTLSASAISDSEKLTASTTQLPVSNDSKQRYSLCCFGFL